MFVQCRYGEANQWVVRIDGWLIAVSFVHWLSHCCLVRWLVSALLPCVFIGWFFVVSSVDVLNRCCLVFIYLFVCACLFGLGGETSVSTCSDWLIRFCPVCWLVDSLISLFCCCVWLVVVKDEKWNLSTGDHDWLVRFCLVHWRVDLSLYLFLFESLFLVWVCLLDYRGESIPLNSWYWLVGSVLFRSLID